MWQPTAMTKRMIFFSLYLEVILFRSLSLGFPSVISTITLVASWEAPASGFSKMSVLKKKKGGGDANVNSLGFDDTYCYIG